MTVEYRPYIWHNSRAPSYTVDVGRGVLLPNLRRLRVERFWTQQELADRAGVTRDTISRLESQPDKRADLPTLRKLTEALGVQPRDLMGE